MNKELIIFNPSIEDGGVEKNLFLITNFLATKGIKTSVISADKHKKKEFNKKVNFFFPQYINFDQSKRYKKYFFCLMLLVKRILFNKTKYIFSFQANIYCIIVSKLLGAKVIVRMNTAPQKWDRSLFKNKIYSYFIKKADIVIVNSSFFQKEVNKRYGIRSFLIHNPFDFKKIKTLSKKKIKYKFDQKKLNLINIGRLTDQKDQITLLKSLTKIKDKNKILLTIIGKGEKRKDLIEFVKNNDLNKYVKFLDYQKNPFPYMNLADVFILSSKFEGSPNVLIEAQILNKHIFSTDCPTGPKEILKNYKKGDLFKVKNYNELAKLIINFKKKSINEKSFFFKELKKYESKNSCKKYLFLVKNIA